MKAITLWQPYASLIACGAKKHETRSWATGYRGPIAIHASSRNINRVLKDMFPLGDWTYSPDYSAKNHFVNAVQEATGFKNLDELPVGCVIATDNLKECYKIIKVFPPSVPCGEYLAMVETGVRNIMFGITAYDYFFGDWTPGRYAWRISDVKMLPEPVPAKGAQGLWNWELPEGGGYE